MEPEVDLGAIDAPLGRLRLALTQNAPPGKAASPNPAKSFTACVSTMLPRDQLPDLWHQIVRYIHDGLGRLDAGYILSQCLVFGQFSVVGKDPLYLVLVPPVWKLALTH